jgi:hypothetical protein
VAAWLAAESARQCGPCRFGLAALAADVASIYRVMGAASRPPPGTRPPSPDAEPAHTPTARPASSHLD